MKRTKYRVFGGYKEAARIAATITAYNLRNIATSPNWLRDCMVEAGVELTADNIEKYCRVAKALGFYAVIRRGSWYFGNAKFEADAEA